MDQSVSKQDDAERAAREERQYKLERKERDRREFEREKRLYPWWYDSGHHICGDLDGH